LGLNFGSSQISLTRFAIYLAAPHGSGTTAAGAIQSTTCTISVVLSEPPGTTVENMQGFGTQRCSHAISPCPRELDICQTHHGHPQITFDGQSHANSHVSSGVRNHGAGTRMDEERDPNG